MDFMSMMFQLQVQQMGLQDIQRHNQELEKVDLEDEDLRMIKKMDAYMASAAKYGIMMHLG